MSFLLDVYFGLSMAGPYVKFSYCPGCPALLGVGAAKESVRPWVSAFWKIPKLVVAGTVSLGALIVCGQNSSFHLSSSSKRWNWNISRGVESTTEKIKMMAL